MTKKLQKQLDSLVGHWVTIHNFNTRHNVFIVTGILQKEKNGFYCVREPRAYVSFHRCLDMADYGKRASTPKIYV